jgi:hypothetical protein
MSGLGQMRISPREGLSDPNVVRARHEFLGRRRTAAAINLALRNAGLFYESLYWDDP